MAKERIPQAQDRVFALPALYAEYAPLADHDSFVDVIYVLKDRGPLTAHRRTFASPCLELAFSFRDTNQASGHIAKAVVIPASFGHWNRGKAFFGWMIGVKFKPMWSYPLTVETDAVVACQVSFGRAISSNPSCVDILDPIDRLLRALPRQTRQGINIGSDHSESSQCRVGKLASELDQSVRTLHRRMRKSTGLPPKRLLALERWPGCPICSRHGCVITVTSGCAAE